MLSNADINKESSVDMSDVDIEVPDREVHGRPSARPCTLHAQST